MRNDGSIQPKTVVAAASTIPPSTQMAWHMHGVVQGVSSLKLSMLRPNKTHGQNSPVKPLKEGHEKFDIIEICISKNILTFCSKETIGTGTPHRANCKDTIKKPTEDINIY